MRNKGKEGRTVLKWILRRCGLDQTSSA